MLRKWWTRLVRRRALADYFEPVFVSGELERQEAYLPQERTVDFVVVRGDESSSRALPDLVAEIVSMGLRQEAMVESIVSNVVIMSFGAHPETHRQGGRERLVEALRANLGERIAIVHGRRTCLVGPFGNSLRMDFGSQIPEFTALLKLLVNLDLGHVEEI